MAYLRVLAFAVCVLFNLVSGNVPVLLWESSKSDRINSFPALHRISSEDFRQYILKKVHGEQPVPLIAVFEEESLSVEDFSWQDSQGQGYFPQLKYITETAANREFLPSVQNPIEAAEQLSDFGYSHQQIELYNAVDLPEGCNKVFIVKLQEAKPDEDRPELLRRHDVKIAEIYSKLLSKCSHVICLLSAPQCSWMEPAEVSRMRRSVDVASSNGSTALGVSGVIYEDKLGLLYTSSAPKLKQDNKETLLNFSAIVTGDNSKPEDIKLFVKYNTQYRLSFNFDNKTNGYWYLRSVYLTTDSPTQADILLKSTVDIVAPVNMSWHSGAPITFSNGTTSITFADLQVQPFFLIPGSKAFTAAVDAVEFFTPAIWSGLFVTFLLALIFTWGLSMIMDIRTMDQFDDPKGKTITVSATD